jgi:soluble lytic murein transglycosylase
MDYLYYLYYPYGYKETVQNYSNQYALDPLFTLAVIRQESHFMPLAGSYAGAQGLMQIMPATGKGIAGQLGIQNYNDIMLLDPEINIKMGTFYLRQQLDNFNQNQFYCLGAYNGGPGKMSEWISKRGSMDIDEFIESISYEQSREYVKIVMGNYYFYQMLYD